MKNMDVAKMTREEFEALPLREWDEEIGEFDALIILPAEISYLQVLLYWIRMALHNLLPRVFTKPDNYSIDGFHESGYRCMDFVICKDQEPVCRLSGDSDFIHLDGIGGYGANWFEKYGRVPDKIPPAGWEIDCLPQSGLLRLRCYGKLTCGPVLDSFEIYGQK